MTPGKLTAWDAIRATNANVSGAFAAISELTRIVGELTGQVERLEDRVFRLEQELPDTDPERGQT